MKARKHSGQLVAELRKIIGKSQTQFAAMIGVSKHTIISVENGRNQLSRNLTERIEIATGADLAEDKLESPYRIENYTSKDFNRWRERHNPSNELAAKREFDEKKKWLKIILLAAAKSGRAGNRDRFAAVCLSFTEWLNDTRQKFKLENEIEDFLEDETRQVTESSYAVSHLLDEPNELKEFANNHGFNLTKLRKELKKQPLGSWLHIEDEYFSNWSPGGGEFKQVCNPRKLIPKPKYWFVIYKPTLTEINEFKKKLIEALKSNTT